MTETICGAQATVHGTPCLCDMRAGHPPLEGHFDTFTGIEWR